MYIIAIEGKEKEGAYSVVDDEGEEVLYIFEEKDDAVRYSMQLEELDFPTMRVIEIESELMIHTCETHGHRYAIISKNDIVIPPDKSDDNL
tara:strand:- start:8993 stop:9265 length:273 start_codon:yes stop_codon:yes gene_type:complete